MSLSTMPPLSRWLVSVAFFVLLLQTCTSLKLNPPELYLSKHKFVVSSTPQVRNYHFVVTNTTGAPDGFTKPMLVINNQYPGPLIECNEGDTLNIVVQNKMDTDVSFHWHGIYQIGTPWMDGVTGVTQCPIPAGSSFTYRFTITRQFGTFWYHAHSRNLAIDGIHGPFIVHSPRDTLIKGRDYDNDYILLMTDWYHNTSTVILNGTLSSAGYNRSTAAPSADSALINGVGIYNCSFAPKGSRCTTRSNPLEITVGPNEKTRFRLIQAGSHAMFWFSADQHTLNITEADSVGVVGPAALRRLQFHNGQRYSVIVDTKQDRVGSAFYLRAAMDLDCWVWLAPGLPGPDATALVIVRVVSKKFPGIISTGRPNTRDWNDTTGGSCVDLNIDTLKPVIKKSLCSKMTGTLYYNTSVGSIVRRNPNNSSQMETLSRFFVDNTTWTTFRFKPVLQDLLVGGQGYVNRSAVTALTLPSQGCYDIVINNLDQNIDHPLHLHGLDSNLVAHGNGFLGPSNFSNVTFRTDNPLRRDTFVVGGGSHLVVRVKAQNPGVWILHCHIGWHLGHGFAGVLVILPNRLAGMRLPAANRALCAGATPSTIGTVEPGRRKRMSKRTELVPGSPPPSMLPNILEGLYVSNDDEVSEFERF